MQGFHFMKYNETVDLFRQAGFEVKELKYASARVANVPELGDRVVAVSSRGDNGTNPLFLLPYDVLRNVHDSAKARRLVFQYACGLRDWTGPEGAGSMSFFHRSLPLTFENNWFVDSDINVPALKIGTGSNQSTLRTYGEMHLRNMRQNRFDILVDKETDVVYDESQVSALENISPVGLSIAGVNRVVYYTNMGKDRWDRKHGHAFIWTLAMMGADDGTTIYIPHRGKHNGESPVVDYRFDAEQKGIPPEMRQQREFADVIQANGRYRYKVGLGPNDVRGPDDSRGIALSYMPSIHTLAILTFGFNEAAPYIDGRWTNLPRPSSGHVFNAYNNLETIRGLPGRFHELEATSERLELAPHGTGRLSTQLVFVTGPVQKLEAIVRNAASDPFIKLRAD